MFFLNIKFKIILTVKIHCICSKSHSTPIFLISIKVTHQERFIFNHFIKSAHLLLSSYSISTPCYHIIKHDNLRFHDVFNKQRNFNLQLISNPLFELPVFMKACFNEEFHTTNHYLSLFNYNIIHC